MLSDYFESLIGVYIPVSSNTAFGQIDYGWVLIALLFIVAFHCVMRLLAVILRRVLGK